MNHLAWPLIILLATAVFAAARTETGRALLGLLITGGNGS